jgi:hypothetical protein
LEGKAFRSVYYKDHLLSKRHTNISTQSHGDIEGVLEELYKNTGGSKGHGGGAAGFLLGVASALATGGRGQKFTKKYESLALS